MDDVGAGARARVRAADGPFGPTVSYNVACVVVPALGAWTAFLLFRYLTRSTWASLVGGYLFGFSSFVLGHQLGGHLNLTATFVLPLLALVVVRRVRGELDDVAFVWRLGALLALQLAISTEVAATATLVLALGLALAYALVPEARGGIASALPPIGRATRSRRCSRRRSSTTR